MSTFDTEQEARLEGEKLLNMMHGEGWTLRVWENMGWCYSVENDGVSVHSPYYKNGNKYYSVLLSARGNNGCGDMFWTPNSNPRYNDPDYKEFTDPNEAVRHQLQIARRFVNNVENVVSNLENKLM